MPAPKFYKIVSTKFEPLNGGSGLWFPPTKSKPGKWMPKVGDVVACRRGYHLVKAVGIVEWLPPNGIAANLCTAEGRGDESADGNKTAFAQARLIKVVGRLDDVSMRLAAADMAERVLPIFYKVHPKDDRPAKAIQAARDFALGKIDAAARDAAWDAASAAEWDAAAIAAARGAATAAAWEAASAAARASASDASSAAATAAARVAASAAARASASAAATDAARGAATAAATAAARVAAIAAARAASRVAAIAAARAANAKIIIAQAKKRLAQMET